MQTPIPCSLMRGGTSKGPFFLAKDLPPDAALRDRVLLAAMGSPDRRQIDGVGGADPLTSKVGIVSLSERAGIDLEFLFAQVSLDKPLVDTTPNCGNMLAAVLPFAIEQGLIPAAGDDHRVRVLHRQHRHGRRHHGRDARAGGHLRGRCAIDGVPGRPRADRHRLPRYCRLRLRLRSCRPARVGTSSRASA